MLVLQDSPRGMAEHYGPKLSKKDAVVLRVESTCSPTHPRSTRPVSKVEDTVYIAINRTKGFHVD